MIPHLHRVSLMRTWLPLLIVSLWASTAGAQAGAHPLTGTAQDFTIGPTADPVSVAIPATGPGTLTITCDGKTFDCRKVSIGGDAKKRVGPPTGDATSATFVVPGGSEEAAYSGPVLHAGVASKNTIDFKPAKAAAPAAKSGEAQVAEWLTTLCIENVSTTATFLATPFGRVIKQTKQRITDRDRITVSIVANENLEPLLSLKEGSELATPSVTNIYGADVAPFRNTSKGPGQPLVPVACRTTPPAPLGPFASPKGVVDIDVHVGLEEKQVGTFQFQVNPTYTASFALGAGLSTAFSPTFQKEFNGTDTVIVAHDTRHRFLYVATYTPYLSGPRDLSFKRAFDPRLFPFVGVVLNDVTNNALLGLSLELQSGFAFIFAQHVARVTTLDTSTGAEVGKAFHNRSATVPTDQHWTSKPFYGVIIDAHAAAGLLKSVIGGGAK